MMNENEPSGIEAMLRAVKERDRNFSQGIMASGNNGMKTFTRFLRGPYKYFLERWSTHSGSVKGKLGYNLQPRNPFEVCV